MIFDALGNGSEGGNSPPKSEVVSFPTGQSLHQNKDMAAAHRHSAPDCAITGPALLQTEQVLLRRAPEFVPIIQQIRKSGAITVQSRDPDLHGTYNLYRVTTSKEGCRMIAEVLVRTLEAQRGHPASLRVLVNIWQELEREMC